MELGAAIEQEARDARDLRHREIALRTYFAAVNRNDEVGASLIARASLQSARSRRRLHMVLPLTSPPGGWAVDRSDISSPSA